MNNVVVQNGIKKHRMSMWIWIQLMCFEWHFMFLPFLTLYELFDFLPLPTLSLTVHLSQPAFVEWTEFCVV